MNYYRLNEEGYVNLYTSDRKVAERNGCTLTTDEEIVMQGDKSGYVLVSEYVAEEKHYVPTIEEQVQANTEAIMEIMEVLDNG